MSKYQVIIIGAGPAGLMAAGQAAGMGVKTLLLEKKAQSGRKLRITGKGRCNLTNTASLEDFIAHFGKQGNFLRQAFNQFFSDELVAFLKALGINIKSERGGRIFPENENAPAVVDALLSWIKREGVIINNNSPVEKLLFEEDCIIGVQTGGKKYYANSVIIATGGVTYPTTGSTGDGYKLAESVGHTIIPIRPALVPLETSGNVAQSLQGLSLRNVKIKIYIDQKKRAEAFGEMLFTHFGLSGPIILTLSNKIVTALEQEKKVELSMDLKPALDEKKLDARLLRDLDTHGKRNFNTFLKGLLPQKLIPVCCHLLSIPSDKISHQINAKERSRLLSWLKDFRFEIKGHRPIAEAIVTAGGVNIREIDPRTMESKKIKGLFFAGEVIDIDGDTGGYNLQAAFSTGWLAGRAVSKTLNI